MGSDKSRHRKQAANRGTSHGNKGALVAAGGPVPAAPPQPSESRPVWLRRAGIGGGVLAAIAVIAAATRPHARAPVGSGLMGRPHELAGNDERWAGLRGGERLPAPRLSGASIDPATRRQVATGVKAVIDLYGDTEPLVREQRQLPTVNTHADCTNRHEQVRSLARWITKGAKNTAPTFDLTRSFDIDFPLVQQKRMVNALISASPGLLDALDRAKEQGIVITWGEEDVKRSVWRKGFKTLHVDAVLRIAPEMAVRNPMSVLSASMETVVALNHELQHALSERSFPHPRAFDSRSAFENAFVDAMALEEGSALYGEMEIARSLFDATGVILSVDVVNYRCGKAQAIFHSEDLSHAQKIAGLSRYVRQNHWAFETNYRNQASAMWAAVHRSEQA